MTTINIYKTYNFVNKDPVIDKLRTRMQDTGTTYKQIHEKSNVSKACLAGWFQGKTRRPQHATIVAVARAMGGRYDLTFPKRKKK